MGVSVCLRAIVIPESLDFLSAYSAPHCFRWSRVQVKVLRLSREGRASGGAERTFCC